MKRLMLATVALFVLLFSSCELSFNKEYEHGKIWYVGYGADFAGISSGVLRYTVSDAVETGHAFRTLSEMSGYQFTDMYFLGRNRGSSAEDTVFSCTREQYFEEVSKINSSENDVLVFFFSSHGDCLEKDVDYYSKDCLNNGFINFYNPEKNTYSEVYFSELLDLIDGLEGTKLILCDTCHSGGFISGNGVSVDKNIYKDKNPSDLLFEKSIEESSSVWILTSCTYYESSAENDSSQHGYFTQALLEGLGWNEKKQQIDKIKAVKNKKITATSLADYVYKNANITSLFDNHQTPVFSGGSGDLILFDL